MVSSIRSALGDSSGGCALCCDARQRVQTTRDAQTGAIFCRLISSNGFILLITHHANEL